MDKSEFYTRKAHNQARKLSLFKPDGTRTDEFLLIQGQHADNFREKSTLIMRRILSEELTKEEIDDLKLEQIASLVDGWSFDQDCNLEDVKNFLKEAPQLKDSINTFAGNHGNFSAKK